MLASVRHSLPVSVPTTARYAAAAGCHPGELLRDFPVLCTSSRWSIHRGSSIAYATRLTHQLCFSRFWNFTGPKIQSGSVTNVGSVSSAIAAHCWGLNGSYDFTPQHPVWMPLQA